MNNVLAVQIFEEMGFNPEQFIETVGTTDATTIGSAGLSHLINYVQQIDINKIKILIAKLAVEIKRIMVILKILVQKIIVFFLDSNQCHIQ